jgi:SWI/SNF-related matrix-associated actin-dependent regulator of chromatin subfamily A member 5
MNSASFITNFHALDHDELDGFSPTHTVEMTELRRSGRERKPTTAMVDSLTHARPTTSRKRALSGSDRRNGIHTAESAAKKLRMDEKKAVCYVALHGSNLRPHASFVVQKTLATNDRRNTRDKLRKKWIYYHRDLFKPLLPPSSGLFEGWSRELGSGPSAIAPFHELHEQPSLIQGAILKDYQMYGLSFLVWMYKNGTLHRSDPEHWLTHLSQE